MRGLTIGRPSHRSSCVDTHSSNRAARQFAHFWLAHVYPLVRELSDQGIIDPFRSTLLLWHGRNRALPRWAPIYTDLLGGSARCTTGAALRATTAEEHARRRRAFRCDAYVPSIAVPAFA